MKSENKEKILCLDLGAHTGYAIFEDKKNIRSGCVFFKKPVSRIYDFETMIIELISTPVHHIFYEKVRRHQGVDAAHAYGAYEGILKKISYQYNIPISGIEVTQIKRALTGSGRADKEMMIKSINEHYNLSITDDNEADALAIGYFVNQ